MTTIHLILKPNLTMKFPACENTKNCAEQQCSLPIFIAMVAKPRRKTTWSRAKTWRVWIWTSKWHKSNWMICWHEKNSRDTWNTRKSKRHAWMMWSVWAVNAKCWKSMHKNARIWWNGVDTLSRYVVVVVVICFLDLWIFGSQFG